MTCSSPRYMKFPPRFWQSAFPRGLSLPPPFSLSQRSKKRPSTLLIRGPFFPFLPICPPMYSFSLDLAPFPPPLYRCQGVCLGGTPPKVPRQVLKKIPPLDHGLTSIALLEVSLVRGFVIPVQVVFTHPGGPRREPNGEELRLWNQNRSYIPDAYLEKVDDYFIEFSWPSIADSRRGALSFLRSSINLPPPNPPPRGFWHGPRRMQ